MAEFTYFTRLEGRPRTNDFSASLAAEVRDPLWFLTRQWQVGEFSGQDAGSVAFIEYAGRIAQLPRWSLDGNESPIDPGAPLERQTLREPFEPDLGMQVELGQLFADFLGEAAGAAADALLAAFAGLSQFQIGAVADAPFIPVDAATKRFLLVCAKRSLNGVALLRLGQAIAAGTGSVPPEVTTDPARVEQVKSALAELVTRVEQVFGEVGSAE